MTTQRWTAEQAWEWYRAQPWLVGTNFIPSTAINQLEMWQAETFDPATIDRELGWAASLGMNTHRVFLHDLLWQIDRDGFVTRLDQFLSLCQKHGARPLLVFFDDCWNTNPAPGRQPTPQPGVHNSGWVQSPGEAVVTDPAAWGRLETYVRGVLEAFGQDERILGWDLYNEPGNRGLGERTLPLLEAVFKWARAANPSQPLTVGVWRAGVSPINELTLGSSDITSFHRYNFPPEELRAEIERLLALGRPVICTEYMARKFGSTFAAYLPVFKETGVAAYNWGLVSGKTNTIYAWGEPLPGVEPPLWFHDIFRADGSPYKADEVETIRHYTSQK